MPAIDLTPSPLMGEGLGRGAINGDSTGVTVQPQPHTTVTGPAPFEDG
jgi:hypothetical protein